MTSSIKLLDRSIYGYQKKKEIGFFSEKRVKNSLFQSKLMCQMCRQKRNCLCLSLQFCDEAAMLMNKTLKKKHNKVFLGLGTVGLHNNNQKVKINITAWGKILFFITTCLAESDGFYCCFHLLSICASTRFPAIVLMSLTHFLTLFPQRRKSEPWPYKGIYLWVDEWLPTFCQGISLFVHRLSSWCVPLTL